jgi:TPR repeat protein
LAVCYKNGEGVEVDYIKSIEYYEKAIQLNHASTLCNLGVLFYKGKGVQQDF